MKEWLVKLKGERSDLDDLPALFNSPELSVKEEQGFFFLRAAEFNSLDKEKEVIGRAKTLLQVITSAASFYFQSFTLLEIQDLILIDEDGNRHEHLYLAPANNLRMRWLGTKLDDGTFVPASKTKYVDHLVRLANKHKEVSQALSFFREDTWTSLYKIYELVKDDVGGYSKLLQKKWTTKTILSRFTGTAQSPDILGVEARHAGKRKDIPPNPMSKFEAHNFIRELIRKWIQTKRT